MTSITVFEHQILVKQDFGSPEDFRWLCEQDFEGIQVNYRQGQWQLKIRHYLGVIRLPSGMQLEILPKISQTKNDQTQNPSFTRQWVQQMLMTIWQTVTPRALPTIARQATIANLPVHDHWLDWLAGYFCEQLADYMPNQQYQILTQNQPYLQGKLLIKQQILHNSHQPHRFFSQSEQLAVDTASNRLVKAACSQLMLLGLLPNFLSTTVKTAPASPSLGQPSVHQLSVHQLLALQAFAAHWQAIAPLHPHDYDSMYQQSQHETASLPLLQQRANQMMMALCQAILSGSQSFANQAVPSEGNQPSPVLLINMQSAFEKWVGMVAKLLFNQVSLQPRQPLVVQDDKPLLSIKADMLIVHGGIRIVADVKYKSIGQVQDISLADIYQLLIYAERYDANQGWLIYPTLEDSAKAMPIHLYEPPHHQPNCHQSQPRNFWLVPFCVDSGQLKLPDSITVAYK